MHIVASELKRLPHALRRGNGRAAPGCAFPIHTRPTALPDAMK